jgi:hypothetical protein
MKTGSHRGSVFNLLRPRGCLFSIDRAQLPSIGERLFRHRLVAFMSINVSANVAGPHDDIGLHGIEPRSIYPFPLTTEPRLIQMAEGEDAFARAHRCALSACEPLA